MLDVADGVRRPGGLSLLEVITAVAVMVPIVVVVAGILPFFRLTSDRAWTLACACDIAHEQLERVRNSAFDAVLTTTAQNEDRNGTRYSWTVDVAAFEAPTAQRKRVVVTVSWQNPQQQNLSIETLVARAGSPSASPSPRPATGTAASAPSATQSPTPASGHGTSQ